jgi:hypothetical protein
VSAGSGGARRIVLARPLIGRRVGLSAEAPSMSVSLHPPRAPVRAANEHRRTTWGGWELRSSLSARAPRFRCARRPSDIADKFPVTPYPFPFLSPLTPCTNPPSCQSLVDLPPISLVRAPRRADLVPQPVCALLLLLWWIRCAFT